MNKQLVNSAFALFSLLIPLGAWLKITHAPAADDFLLVGICSWLLFGLLLFLEMMKASYIDRAEKWRWALGFLFFGWFAAALYLLKYRKVRV